MIAIESTEKFKSSYMVAFVMGINKLAVASMSPRLSLFQSLAQLAPLPTLIFTIQEIFGYSDADALSYLIALIIVLFSANTVVQMGKRFPHAGGYYGYVANGISRSTGVYTQFMFLFYQILNTAGVVIFGSWVLQIFLELFGITIRGFYFLPIPLILIFILVSALFRSLFHKGVCPLYIMILDIFVKP